MCAAVESHYERYGQAGAPTALAHVVTALLRAGAAPAAAPSSSSAAPSPLVYVLDPPLVMAEPSARGPPCIRMHACSYHPSLPCWHVAECVTCVRGDQVRQGGWPGNRPPEGKEAKPWKPAEGKCVRADLLKRLRLGLGAAVAGLGARAPLRHGRHRGERAGHAPGGQGAHGAHDADACAAGGVRAAAPQLSQSMPSSWRQYTGPIHLNTIGSAHLACLVHEALFLRCAAHCGGNLSAQMASRHQLFCQPFHQLRREEPLPTQALDELESRLHAAGDRVAMRA